MTFIQRVTKATQSVADGAITAVSDIGTAVAVGVVVVTDDIQGGIKAGRIRPATLAAAVSVGLIAVLELPVLVAAGGIALITTKLKNHHTGADRPGPDQQDQ